MDSLCRFPPAQELYRPCGFRSVTITWSSDIVVANRRLLTSRLIRPYMPNFYLITSSYQGKQTPPSCQTTTSLKCTVSRQPPRSWCSAHSFRSYCAFTSSMARVCQSQPTQMSPPRILEKRLIRPRMNQRLPFQILSEPPIPLQILPRKVRRRR
jgi:hypothetical protein